MAERPSALREFLEKLHQERRALLSLLQGLSEEEASHRPEGGWSVKEQLAHLCDAERGWLEWAFFVRDHPGEPFGPPDPEVQPFPPPDDANDSPLRHWITRLKAVRWATLHRLQTAHLTEEDLQRRGRHRAFGEMSVLQCLRALYRHDRMHRDQIQGRPPSFVPGERPAEGRTMPTPQQEEPQ